ncbi:MAG: hypothetical protein ACSLFD_04955 [Solirubrobacterales bacterium]
MAKRFEFHLEGMDAPEGLIDADRLVEIVKSLQEMTVRLGRIETESAPSGRPSKSLDRVASLRIGLQTGSTTIIAERDVAEGALDLDLPDEEAVDRRFAELIEGIGADLRPPWVTDSLASTAADLVAALQRTAPRVELKVDGVTRKTFETQAIHRDTWQPSATAQSSDEVAFTGQLFAVNLNTHRLQVQDDVGNHVALPKVQNDTEIGKLVGSHVKVRGMPEFDLGGRLIVINDASVESAPDPLGGSKIPTNMSLDQILSSAPGPELGGIAGLTDAEVDAFLEAIG